MNRFFTRTIAASIAAIFGVAGIAWAATVPLGSLGTATTVAGTDSFAICQQASPCTIGQALVAGTVTQLMTFIKAQANAWTAPQRTNTGTPGIATTTFTPVFSTSQNIRIVFPATTCSCTIANPASIVAGQSGMFELVQGGTSASANPTWGSEYVFAGGTSTIVLTTTLSGVDYIPYYVDSTGTFIVLGNVVLKPVH